MSKLDEVKFLVQEWIDKQGHDKCWYYPDIFNRLASVLGLNHSDPGLPPRSEFEKGCCKYQDEIYVPMSRSGE